MTRRSGITTRAMLAAPHGVVYVWPNQKLLYPRQLAEFLKRDDLVIVGPSWLDAHRALGRQPVPTVTDHMAVRLLTDEQFAMLRRQDLAK